MLTIVRFTSTPAAEASNDVERFSRCIDDVQAWMNASRFRLNALKTEVMWFGSRQQLEKILTSRHFNIVNRSRYYEHIARVLLVLLDCELSLTAHVLAPCKAGFYQLR